MLQRTKEGRDILIESTITRIEEPDPVLLIETGRDITRRKELEEALHHRVVGRHGGRVSAHSAGIGRDSQFVVRLPLLADARAR